MLKVFNTDLQKHKFNRKDWQGSDEFRPKDSTVSRNIYFDLGLEKYLICLVLYNVQFADV